uniref:RRM domain-containing protein n=1 Tax=Oryza meridionalis TaxID=40149 RepID=A0A0E0C0E3_9ORYZ
MGKKRKLDSKSPAAARSAAARAAAAAAAAAVAEPSSQPEALAEDPAPSSQPLGQASEGAGERMVSREAGGGEEEEVEEVEVEEEVEVDEDEDGEGEEEEEAAERDADSIQALLNSFPKDQLVELLSAAALNHEDVLTAIHRAADADPALRKIFVHGLGWDATAETLTEAFSAYGEIEDLRVVTDRATGKCKGYGFILFSRRSGARAALHEPQKKIGNRTTACQLASVGPVPPGGMATNPAPAVAPAPAQLALPPVSEYTQRKIFVSNVGADIDPQKLLQFFSKYGEIEEGPLGLDKVTGKPKGFALFVYKTLDSAKKALQEPHKQFEGVVLHCQKAIDGPKPNKGGGLGGLYGAGTSGGRKGAGGYGAHSHSLPGAAVGGHVMPSPVSSLTSLPGVAGGPGVNPALGQALTAILASQGGGLGLNNILGVGANGSGLPNPGASAGLGSSGLPGMPGAGGYLGGYGGGGGYGSTPPGGPGRNYMGH